MENYIYVLIGFIFIGLIVSFCDCKSDEGFTTTIQKPTIVKTRKNTIYGANGRETTYFDQCENNIENNLQFGYLLQ